MKFLRSKLLLALAAVAGLLAIAGMALYEPDIPVTELKKNYANAQSKFIEIDGLQVHYRIEGKGEPLVLIHGTGSMLQTWDEWTTTLSPYYTVIRMDIPAFGLTGPRPDGNYSDTMYTGFIEQLVTKLGIGSFYLAGNSLGGFIAWKYAATYPGRVKKLILVDPGGFYEANKKAGAFVFKAARNLPGITRLFSALGTGYFVKHTLQEVYADDSKITEQQITMYTQLNRRAGNRQALVDRMRHIRQCSDDELKTITCPTLVMWGKQDQLIDVREAEHFKQVPLSSFIIYDNTGHCPQEEIPARSAADVMRFLQ